MNASTMYLSLSAVLLGCTGVMTSSDGSGPMPMDAMTATDAGTASDAGSGRDAWSPPADSGIVRERVPGLWRRYLPRPFMGVDLEGTGRDPFVVDALAETLMDLVPGRSFAHTVVAPDGIAYLRGGGHGDYPGSDTMTVDLGGLQEESAGAPWVQEHRPHVPNGVDNGYPQDNAYYCCGYGSFDVWYPGYPAPTSTEPTPTTWEPFGLHYASRQSWHPRLGYVFIQGRTLLGWDGATPRLTAVTDGGGALAGLVSFDRASKRYTTVGGTFGGDGVDFDLLRSAALSDYDDVHDALLIVTTRFERSSIVEFRDDTYRLVRTVEEGLVGQRGNEAGFMHYLGEGVHLVVDPNESYGAPSYKVYDHRTGLVRTISPPAEVDPSVWNLYFAPDVAGRSLYALARSLDGTTVLYRTTIPELTDWTRLDTSGAAPTITTVLTLGIGQKNLWFWNGTLHFFNWERLGGTWGSVVVYALDL